MSALVIGKNSLGTFKNTLVQNGFDKIGFMDTRFLGKNQENLTSINYDIVVLKTDDMKKDELKTICKKLTGCGAPVTLW